MIFDSQYDVNLEMFKLRPRRQSPFLCRRWAERRCDNLVRQVQIWSPSLLVSHWKYHSFSRYKFSWTRRIPIHRCLELILRPRPDSNIPQTRCIPRSILDIHRLPHHDIPLRRITRHGKTVRPHRTSIIVLASPQRRHLNTLETLQLVRPITRILPRPFRLRAAGAVHRGHHSARADGHVHHSGVGEAQEVVQAEGCGAHDGERHFDLGVDFCVGVGEGGIGAGGSVADAEEAEDGDGDESGRCQ